MEYWLCVKCSLTENFLKKSISEIPIHNTPPRGDVVRAAVLVVKVVGVLPNVEAEDGRKFLH